MSKSTRTYQRKKGCAGENQAVICAGTGLAINSGINLGHDIYFANYANKHHVPFIPRQPHAPNQFETARPATNRRGRHRDQGQAPLSCRRQQKQRATQVLQKSQSAKPAYWLTQPGNRKCYRGSCANLSPCGGSAPPSQTLPVVLHPRAYGAQCCFRHRANSAPRHHPCIYNPTPISFRRSNTTGATNLLSFLMCP